jgi:hypothetical protein
VLARRADDDRFRKIEVYSPRNVLHAFRLSGTNDIDEQFAAYLEEAYHVGLQHHR